MFYSKAEYIRVKETKETDVLTEPLFVKKDNRPFLIAGPCSAETEEQTPKSPKGDPFYYVKILILNRSFFSSFNSP